MNIYQLVESTLAGLGYELVDLEISGRGPLIRIFMDGPEGIDVDDCAKVSNHLTKLFAVESIDFSRLEVSSPGLDRLLKKESDFVRFTGEKAQIKLRVPIEGRRKFVGILKTVRDGELLLDVEGTLFTLDLKNIDRARLVPNL